MPTCGERHVIVSTTGDGGATMAEDEKPDAGMLLWFVRYPAALRNLGVLKQAIASRRGARSPGAVA